MPDVSTEVAIATTTLGSAASSITFSSIPSTYTDLRLVLVGAANGTENVVLRFNGNTATNYSWTRILGDGSTAQSGRATSQEYMRVSTDNFGTTVGMVQLDVFSYAGSTFKTVLSAGSHDNNGSGDVGRLVGLWRSTSAINSVQVAMRYGAVETFTAGTTATLYGIL
jgi:hypothetical protein